jgi:hypothetical protein
MFSFAEAGGTAVAYIRVIRNFADERVTEAS